MLMEPISFSNRNSTFMQSGLPRTLEEFSRFRSDAAISLRKQKRQKFIIHKRLKKLEDSPGTQISLEDALQNLSLSNLSSIKAFRILLCNEKFDFVKLAQIRPNIVQYLAKGLESNKNELAFEVSWCFANLALGVPMLVNEVGQFTYNFAEIIIGGKERTLAEQACWVLGNLAADDSHKKEIIRRIPGLTRAIVNLLNQRNNSLASVACWTLCNILRGPLPDPSEALEAGALLPVLELTKKNYSCQVIESLWLLSFLIYKSNEDRYVYEPEQLEIYKKYLTYNEAKIVLPIVRILGHGFLCDKSLDSLFYTADFSEMLLKLISNENIQIKKESVWLVSNILSSNYVNSLTNYIGDQLLKLLLKLFSEDLQELKTEAGIALYNLAEVYNSVYLPRILETGGPSIIMHYVSNISNVPTWVKFNIQVVCDVDLLKVSLGFIALCLETLDLPKEIEDLLFSSEVKDAIEDCKYTLLKASSISGPEELIISLCDYIFSRYSADFTFS